MILAVQLAREFEMATQQSTNQENQPNQPKNPVNNPVYKKYLSYGAEPYFHVPSTRGPSKALVPSKPIRNGQVARVSDERSPLLEQPPSQPVEEAEEGEQLFVGQMNQTIVHYHVKCLIPFILTYFWWEYLGVWFGINTLSGGMGGSRNGFGGESWLERGIVVTGCTLGLGWRLILAVWIMFGRSTHTCASVALYADKQLEK